MSRKVGRGQMGTEMDKQAGGWIDGQVDTQMKQMSKWVHRQVSGKVDEWMKERWVGGCTGRQKDVLVDRQMNDRSVVWWKYVLEDGCIDR